MSIGKRELAVILLVWGTLVTLFGALLLVLLVPMVLESGVGSEFAAHVILGVIILLVTSGLGVLPLCLGVRLLKTKGKNVGKTEKIIAGRTQATDSGMMPEREENYGKAAETAIRVEEELSSASGRILCRDKQYDKGTGSLIGLLLKGYIVAMIPIVLTVWCYQFVSESAGHRIQVGSWQAYAGLLLVVAGSVLAVYGLVMCGKYNALGNKFYYFIIDENDGLSMAHMGQGRLGAYVAGTAPLLEKVKATPSVVYLLIYLFSAMNRTMAYRLAKMEMYFKVNQKHHFVEKVLMGDNYAAFCQRVVGVKKLKFFSRGCQVTLVCMEDGVEREVKQIIYRETTNYDLLMSKIKELEPQARGGYELSDNHVKQVRKNIGRRLVIRLVCIAVLVGIMLSSFRLYLATSYKVSVLEPGLFRLLEQRLAGRSRRRVMQVFYVCVTSVFLVIGKLVLDMCRPNVFTYIPVEVKEYSESRRSFLRRLEGDYRYFATVPYNNGTVQVGLGKDMWEKREHARPLLVLRKNVPYCLIYQEIS